MAFSKFMLTTGGMTLYAKAQQGKQLHFTRMALGDGLLGGGSLINRSALISEKMSILIDAIQLINDSTDAAIISTLSNVGLSEGFTAREIGLFAEDPDTYQEGLYLYSHAGIEGEPIPAGNSGTLVYERLKILVTLENTGTVTFEASGNPLYLSAEDVAPIIQASLSGADAKTTIVDDDTMPLSDSADSFKQKKISFLGLKTALQAFFDLLYNYYVHPTTPGNIHIPTGGAADNILIYGGSSGTASWTDVFTKVRSTVLTGLSTATNTAIVATDSILIALGKLQAQINNIASTVRSTVLTGLSTSNNAVITATDTVLSALGKLQAQISSNTKTTVVTLTSSGSWTPPKAGIFADIWMIGGGAGGGNANTGGAGGAGGGGGGVVKFIKDYYISTTSPIPYTIGAGGAAGTNGGLTNFGPFFIKEYAYAGKNSNTTPTPDGGAGGAGGGGGVGIDGNAGAGADGTGGDGNTAVGNYRGLGGTGKYYDMYPGGYCPLNKTLYGGAGGGGGNGSNGLNNIPGANGGAGGGGKGGSSGVPGAAGSMPGAGGGGGCGGYQSNSAGNPGGAGKAGIIVIAYNS